MRLIYIHELNSVRQVDVLHVDVLPFMIFIY